MGMLDRFANSVREVEIGYRNHSSIVLHGDVHDTLQGMVGLFLSLDVVNQVHDFLSVHVKIITLQGNNTGGHTIMDALAGRA